MRNAAESVPANISEARGRSTPRDRSYRCEIARGEAEEAKTHVGSNYRSGRISKAEYFPIHNLLTTIVKMLDSLIAE